MISEKLCLLVRVWMPRPSDQLECAMRVYSGRGHACVYSCFQDLVLSSIVDTTHTDMQMSKLNELDLNFLHSRRSSSSDIFPVPVP